MSKLARRCKFIVEKRQNSGRFNNSTSVALQQCQNQASFLSNGSGVKSKLLLIILKSLQCFLFTRGHFLSFKKCGENLNTMPKPIL